LHEQFTASWSERQRIQLIKTRPWEWNADWLPSCNIPEHHSTTAPPRSHQEAIVAKGKVLNAA
jgi:hypothetical protein